MPSFCHFWRVTPQEFWALSQEEFNRMSMYQNEYIRKQEEQMRRANG